MPATAHAPTKTRSSLADAIARQLQHATNDKSTMSELNGDVPCTEVPWQEFIRAVEAQAEGIVETSLFCGMTGGHVDVFDHMRRLTDQIDPGLDDLLNDVDRPDDPLNLNARIYEAVTAARVAGFTLGLVLGRKLGGGR